VRTNKRTDLAALEQLIAEREVGSHSARQPHQYARHGRPAIGWVHEFAAALEKQTGLPVKLWDERLTSVEAGRVLRASGISIEKRAAAVDRLSAVILLQSYLDSLMKFWRTAGVAAGAGDLAGGFACTTAPRARIAVSPARSTSSCRAARRPAASRRSWPRPA
jgi:putative holliday junction resolvase